MRCPTLFPLLLLALAPIAGQDAARVDVTSADAKLEIVGAQRTQPSTEAEQLSIRFWLQQLMLSALHRDVVQESTAAEWEQKLSAPSRIYCRYSTPATLAIPERRTLVIDEVLLPLPTQRYPDFIFVKQGQRVLRLSKHDPWVLHKLVSVSGFSLYNSLATVERTLF